MQEVPIQPTVSPPKRAEQDSLVHELLAHWEQERGYGRELTPEELCRDHPHLVPAVRQGMALLRQMLTTTTPSQPTVPQYQNPLIAVTLPELLQSGRFQIRGMLGKGGMGIVYRAWDAARQCEVALKTLPAWKYSSLIRFKQEFRSRADLLHPNLVALYDLVAEEPHWFFTMELIDGTSFLDYVRPPVNGRQLDEGRLRKCLAQLATGVKALHLAGKLHRDLKPSNVSVTQTERVVLLDFGLAADMDLKGEHKSRTGQVVGTMGYMAPEQAVGQAVSPASDWYAVGVMLYEALAGQLPFGTDAQALLDKNRLSPPSVEEHNPQAPPDLVDICCKLMQLDPNARLDGVKLLEQFHPHLEQNEIKANTVTAFVGRNELLRSLESALDQVRQGKLVTIEVVGPSGVGKSALLRQFFQSLGTDVIVLKSRCYQQEAVPFKAMDGVIDELCRRLQRWPAESVLGVLPRKPNALARLFPVFNELPSMQVKELSGSESGDAAEVRRRAFAGLRELLSRMGDRGRIVLAIDDVQWGDQDSAALLLELLRLPEPPSLLVILAYRSELADSSVTNAFRMALPPSSPNAQRLQLHIPLLTRSEIQELSLELLGSFSSVIGDQLAKESEGLPLLLLELARAASQGSVPTWNEAIEKRIAQVPEPVRRIVEILALAGVPLPSTTCLRGAGLPVQLHEPLQFLSQERFIRAADSGARVVIYHDRIRDAILLRLSRERKVELLDRLLTVLADESDIHPDTLAGLVLSTHQHSMGSSIDHVLESAQRAGDRAKSSFAFNRAVEWYQTALELLEQSSQGLFGDPNPKKKYCNSPKNPRRFELEKSLGIALSLAGRNQEAAQAFGRALLDAIESEKLELKQRIAQQLLTGGHVADGTSVLKEVLQTVGLTLPSSQAGTILRYLGVRAWLPIRQWWEAIRPSRKPLCQHQTNILDACWIAATGYSIIDPILAGYFIVKQLTLYSTNQDSERLGRSLALFALHESSTSPKLSPYAEHSISRAQQIAERLKQPTLSSFVKLCSGSIAYLHMNWSTAWKLLSDAGAMHSQSQDTSFWERDTCAFLSTCALLWLGRYPEMRQQTLDGIANAQVRGDRYLLTSLGTYTLPIVRLMEDLPELALKEGQEFLDQWDVDANHIQHLDMAAMRVQIRLYQGDAKAAWVAYQDGARKLSQSYLKRVTFFRWIWTELQARTLMALLLENPIGNVDVSRKLNLICRKLSMQTVTWLRGMAYHGFALLARVENRVLEAENWEKKSHHEFECACMPQLITVGMSKVESQSFVTPYNSAGLENQLELPGVKNPIAFARMLLPASHNSSGPK